MTNPTPTDWRALCAELLAGADEYTGMNPYMRLDNAMKAARAALAQPEPQVPTDEDLYDLAEVFNGDPVPAMRRALELWGRPAIKPVPVAERLPGPEDCDGEGKCYAWDGYWWLVRSTVLEEDDTGAGEGYTHWLPANALPVPQQEAE